ncbi:MAG: hypothetical protein K8J31_04470 [Anaerolineae bacterium]|nr:hypothetical protein [Anaerolineae bacterium]
MVQSIYEFLPRDDDLQASGLIFDIVTMPNTEPTSGVDKALYKSTKKYVKRFYREHISEMPCVLCGDKVSTFHHIISQQDTRHMILRNYKMGTDEDHITRIPMIGISLCRPHHDAYEEVNEMLLRRLRTYPQDIFESNLDTFDLPHYAADADSESEKRWVMSIEDVSNYVARLMTTGQHFLNPNYRLSMTGIDIEASYILAFQTIIKISLLCRVHPMLDWLANPEYFVVTFMPIPSKWLPLNR